MPRLDIERSSSNESRCHRKLRRHELPVAQYLLFPFPVPLPCNRDTHLVRRSCFRIGTGGCKSEQLHLKVGQVDFFRNLIVFDKTKSGKMRVVEMNSEVRQILLDLCKGKKPDDYVWINPVTEKPYTDIKRSFSSACEDAKIEGLVWHDLRATFGTRLGEAGYNAYDIANLMGHANLSTSQRYVRHLSVGGVAVLLKN